MKAKVLIMAMLVMIFSAVEGYAQKDERDRGKARVERPVRGSAERVRYHQPIHLGRANHHRFVCHRLYHNRFFDNLLGYYVWGTLTAPTRLDIGNISFTRYSDRLKIQVGSNITYLDMYCRQVINYTVGYTSVEVKTGNGCALVYFYDEYGNGATYRL